MADIITSTSMSISAIVVNPNDVPLPSQPLSPTASPPDIIPTDITFSGIAYPHATVFLLLNSAPQTSTAVNTDGSFVIKFSLMTSGVEVFSLVAEDASGVRSGIVNIPLTISTQTSTIVSDIFIPPTIVIDKNSYEQADTISIHGYADPLSIIIPNVDSKDYKKTSTANSSGYFNFTIDTKNLALGQHTIQLKAQDTKGNNLKTSVLGISTSFIITTHTNGTQNDTLVYRAAHIDGNNVIDIRDFAIMVYWYLKPNPPKNVDLNGDGIVDMKDFSMLAYYWND